MIGDTRLLAPASEDHAVCEARFFRGEKMNERSLNHAVRQHCLGGLASPWPPRRADAGRVRSNVEMRFGDHRRRSPCCS
jgi:hypothetical protein